MMEPTETLAASQGTRSDAASSGVLCDSALDGLPEECDGLPESWYFHRPPAGSATLKPQGPDVPAASQDVQAPHDLAVTVLLQGEVAPKVLAAAPDEMAPNETSAASASSADAGRGRGRPPSKVPPPRPPNFKALSPGYLLPSSSPSMATTSSSLPPLIPNTAPPPPPPEPLGALPEAPPITAADQPQRAMQCPACRRVLCQSSDLAFFHRVNPARGVEMHLMLKPENAVPTTFRRAAQKERGALETWQCACGAKLGDTRPVGVRWYPMTAFKSASVMLCGVHLPGKKSKWPAVYNHEPFDHIEVRTRDSFQGS